jgi:hypothetical protein
MDLPGMIALIVAALLAQDTQFSREGDHFVRISKGSAPGVARLHVITRAHVVLRGSTGERVVYRMTQQVKTRSEVEAHRSFSGSIESTIPGGGATILTVMPGSSRNVTNELEINVPKQVLLATIENREGGVEAYDFDGSLQLLTTAGLVRCDRIRGAVHGQTGGGEIRIGRVGGAVHCVSGAGSIFIDNAGSEATCQTKGGEIVVREGVGALILSTDGGNIQVDKAGSSVEAHSGEGVIEVLQAAGTVTADTRGGSIQIGSARGIKCESGAGAIRVKNASGPLMVSTLIGSILAELLAGARIENSSLVAGSGDVTVLIPSKLAISVQARNDSGGNPRIISDFSEVPVRSIGFSRPPLVAEGAINGGGPVLRINVASGVIYLRKLK